MTDVIPAQRFVGSSVPRSEDRRILTGAGTYVDDMQLPGMLHAASCAARLRTRASRVSTRTRRVISRVSSPCTRGPSCRRCSRPVRHPPR